MSSNLEELSKTVKILIGEHLENNDIQGVRTLSETAVRIKRLQEHSEALEREIEAISSRLTALSERTKEAPQTVPSITPAEIDLDFEIPGSRSPAKKLKIELDWSRAGKPWKSEILSDNLASSTVARFIERLVSAYGATIIDKLSKFRVNRGPVVSMNPKDDFVNRSTGGTYGHQEIKGTGYFVLTHSSTAQKVTDIREMCRFLGLPIGLVSVTDVDKSPSRAALLASL